MVRAADMQQILSQSAYIEKIHQSQQQAQIASQQHLAVKFHQQLEEQRKQVQQPGEADPTKIQEEKTGRGPGYQSFGERKKEEGGEKKPSETIEVKKEGTLIDIKA